MPIRKSPSPHDADHHAPGALQRERRADRQARPRAHAAAAVGAEVIQRMAEMAVRAVPAERQLGEADVHALRSSSLNARASARMRHAPSSVGQLASLFGCTAAGRALHGVQQKRHRDIRLAHHVHVGWRQPLVVDAPAAMDVRIDRDADHLGADRLVAPRRLQRAGGVDPVEREDDVGTRAASLARPGTSPAARRAADDRSGMRPAS